MPAKPVKKKRNKKSCRRTRSLFARRPRYCSKYKPLKPQERKQIGKAIISKPLRPNETSASIPNGPLIYGCLPELSESVQKFYINQVNPNSGEDYERRSAYSQVVDEVQKSDCFHLPSRIMGTGVLRILSFNVSRFSEAYSEEDLLEPQLNLLRSLDADVLALRDFKRIGDRTKQGFLGLGYSPRIALCETVSTTENWIGNVVLTKKDMLDSDELEVAKNSCMNIVQLKSKLWLFNVDITGKYEDITKIIKKIADSTQADDKVIITGTFDRTRPQDFLNAKHSEFGLSMDPQSLQSFTNAGYTEFLDLAKTRLTISSFQGVRQDYIFLKNLELGDLRAVFVIPTRLSDHFALGFDLVA